ncbi:MAG TPA: sugar phosphate isomerase/epimerase [Tepidisphaeraceae bacterium]|jgi:sugar phosphate isomerase/epimerase|nr:sugar phosphate isomerase/epimerase [Tepidisphaeraceae bacterium]
MPASQIAAQLYTLREFTKTPADIVSTLKRVKRMGYDAVQASALGKIDPKELARIYEGEGLTCCATHTPLDRLRKETSSVIDEHHLWKCRYTAIGGFYPTDPATADWTGFAADYSQVAKQYKSGGLSLGYHNHNHELASFDGKSALQILLDGCSKELWFELDTYWLVAGGADPVQWISKVAGRIPCIHLKDMIVTPKREQRMAEVGQGNLNWPGILAAARTADTEWFIVEQDDMYGADPFECLATSLRNLKEMGLY